MTTDFWIKKEKQWSYPISQEDMWKLIYGASSEDELRSWLAQYVQKGQLNPTEASDIFKYASGVWELFSTSVPDYARLPGGQTAVDVYANYIRQNLPVSPDDWDRLNKGLTMEAENLRNQVIVANQKNQVDVSGVDRLRAISEEYKKKGLSGTEAGKQAREALADAEDEITRGQGIARAGGGAPSGEFAEKGYWSTPRPTALGGFEVGQATIPKYVPPEPYKPPEFESIGGSQSWKEWFSYSYPTIAKQYWGMGSPSLREEGVEKRTEQTWADLLQKEREKFQSLGAYRRGERPSAFSPRVQTVRF